MASGKPRLIHLCVFAAYHFYLIQSMVTAPTYAFIRVSQQGAVPATKRGVSVNDGAGSVTIDIRY
jgi:hypothetical protein